MWNIFNKPEKLDKRWLWSATAAYLVMLVVNGLAGSTTLINGLNTAQVSDSFPNLFAPAGFTFAIWGVIYVLLGVLIVRSFELFKPKKPLLPVAIHNQTIKLFTITSVLNIAWLFAWQYKWLLLSVVLMIALLVCLLKIIYPLAEQKLSTAEALSVRTPFMVYAGWISVATIADITTWLVSINWSGWGMSNAAWTITILIVGTIIAVATSLKLKNWAYLVVFVWAYFGILAKHLTTFDAEYTGVITTLGIALALFISVALNVQQGILPGSKRS